MFIAGGRLRLAHFLREFVAEAFQRACGHVADPRGTGTRRRTPGRSSPRPTRASSVHLDRRGPAQSNVRRHRVDRGPRKHRGRRADSRGAAVYCLGDGVPFQRDRSRHGRRNANVRHLRRTPLAAGENGHGRHAGPSEQRSVS